MRFTYEELEEMLNVLTIQSVRLQDAMHLNPSRKREFENRLRIINNTINKLEIKLLNI